MDYTYGRTILQEVEFNFRHANVEHTVRITEQTCVCKKSSSKYTKHKPEHQALENTISSALTIYLTVAKLFVGTANGDSVSDCHMMRRNRGKPTILSPFRI
jgi:hypothetical protein